MTSLIELASMQARWLSTRQAVVSQNIANSSTPGYVAKDVAPFSEVLARQSAIAPNAPIDVSMKQESWEVRASGNSVSTEQELIKAGDISREHQMNMAITKAFHRMFLAAAKG